jgi:hypothetical protein
MNKREIYEHLADIYLDNSGKKKKGFKKFFDPRVIYLAVFLLTIVVSIPIFIFVSHKSSLKSQVALVIQPTSVRMNFHRGATKKEIFSFDINQLDLAEFNTLSFSIRKLWPADIINIRVEINNKLKERSAIYLDDLSYKWKNYEFNLSDFKNVTNWKKMDKLSFIIEEWNIKGERGIVYIDNVKFIKEE